MSGTANILLVEDELGIAEGIQENLRAEGYQVEHVAHGQVALDRVLEDNFDLVVLDVMLPGLDGFTICERIRERGLDVPILFLTAKGGGDDRIRGLDVGGDDYLPKPFRLKELLLRVQAILRRRLWLESARERSPLLRFGDNEFDVSSMRGRSWDGRTHELTQKEALILQALAEREGEVVSRDDILDKAWGYDVFPSSRTIDNFIVRLRKRFERRPEEPVHFHTVRGIGYRFTREDET